MKETLVSFFKEKELLVSPEALDAIMKKDNPVEFARELASKTGKLFIELEDVQEPEQVTPDIPSETQEKEITVQHSSFKPPARDIEPRVKMFDQYDVTGKSSSSGNVEDFIDLFNDRFQRLSSVLKMRGKVSRDIETLKKHLQEGETRVIGMVSSIRTTKNGHRFISLEDTTGMLNVLIPASNVRLIQESYSIVPDDVVAVAGNLKRDLFITSSVYFPDVPSREPNKADEDIYLAMLSDMHIGSKLFLGKNFEKFLNWINGSEGSEKHREIAGKVKYITIAGDLVDGVGIYPGQEQELETDNIFEQYKHLSELLSRVPDYVEMIAIPGNHDATRIAEPQPAIDNDLLGELSNLPNFRCIGNPGYVSLHGVEVLLYHGASIHSMVPHVLEASYEKPEKTMLEWLKRRHLHPVYGERPPICPEKRDYLVIERLPDVLHAGDVHRNAYLSYRGIVGVNSGTWQDITPYQLKQGHTPTPCILPLFNLRTGKLSVIRFEEVLN